MTTTIGFIGLGAMGMPMARRLAASGFHVQGYDPFAPVASDDVVRAASAAHAVAGADLVCVMVATPAQATAALTGDEGALAHIAPGTVVVMMATVGPDAALALAASVTAAGGRFVDAPVSGGVTRAGTGDLLIMVSGEPDAVEASGAVLDTLGSTVHRLSDSVGDAQRMKLVNQLLCGVHIAAAGEALAYAQSIGIEPAVAFDVVSSGAAQSFMLTDRGRRMVDGSFSEPRSAIDIFVKDLGLVRSASPHPLPLAEAALSRFAAVSERGDGRLDDSAVITDYPLVASRPHPEGDAA